MVRAFSVLCVVALVAAAVVAVGCERPPVAPPGSNKPLPKGKAGPLDLEAFVQDRHAIEGKWYVYDSSTHTQTPKPQAWIVRDLDSDGNARFAAFRITSIYDDTESGLFTLGRATHDGAAWSSESAWVSPRNEKVTGPVCLDLFSGDDVDCAGDAWQLRLGYFKYFAPLSAFFVNDPGVFVRSLAGTDAYGEVRIARVDDVTSLDSLPDPASLEELDDGPGDSWDSTDWSFDALAPDLPEAGMAIGARFVDDGFTGRDDVSFLLSRRFDCVRFTVRPVTDGDPDAGLSLSFASVAVSFEDLSFDDHYPDAQSATVPVPATDGATWLRFDVEGLVVAGSELEDAEWPHLPPPTAAWDLAVVRTGDDVRLWVSPSAAVLNATQRGVDLDLPPVFSE